MMRARPWLAVAAGALVLVIAPVARADDELSLDLGGSPLELRRIPKGTFTQGSSANEQGHEKDEEAPRPVTIARDFWIAKTPVTRGQFARFVADARYVTEAEKGESGGWGWDGKQLVQHKEYTWRNPGFTQGDDHPVVLVTYGDATAFAAWAARKTGRRVRLPTEAEYEYAARAKTTTPWYGGMTAEDALASGWFKPNAGAGTHPVAQKKPNAFGLFDMSGNVYEWCRDVYAPSYPAKPAVDPEVTIHTGPDPERRVLRGGSWLKDTKRGRSAARFRSTPGSRNADYGFRVVVAEDDVLAPGVGTPSDFAPASPLPLGSTPRPPVPVQDASNQAAAPPASTGLGWLLIAGPIAAGAAVVAWMLGRRRANTMTSPSGATTRATADGFFVALPDPAPGTRIRYSCIVNGTEVTDVVPIDGAAETFVYTGSPPSAIQILEVVLPAGGGFRAAQPRPSPGTRAAGIVVVNQTQNDDDDDDSPSPPAPFAGYPRAY